MRQNLKYQWGRLWGLALCLSLAACGGGSSGSETTETKPETTIDTAAKSASTPAAAPVAVVVQPTNTTGRLLASNCFQCHGTMGTGGFDSIRGKDANEVYEYLTKSASSDIMAAHAQGYTKAQLQAIVAYLQK